MYQKKDVDNAMLYVYQLGVSEEDFATLTGLSMKRVNDFYSNFKYLNKIEVELSDDEIEDILRSYKILLACYEAGLSSVETLGYIPWSSFQVEMFWNQNFKETVHELIRKKHLDMGLNPLLVLAAYKLIEVDIEDFYSDCVELSKKYKQNNNDGKRTYTVAIWDLINYYLSGMTIMEISNITGCSHDPIAFLCKLFRRLDLKEKRSDALYIQRNIEKLSKMAECSLDEAECFFEDMREQYIKGVLSDRVAKELDVPVEWVVFCYKMCLHLGLYEEKMKNKKVNDETRESIKVLYEKGYNVPQVCEELDLSNKPVTKVFQELAKTESYKVREDYIMSLYLRVYEMYISGVKRVDIARQLGITTNQVVHRLNYVRTHVDPNVLNDLMQSRVKSTRDRSSD